jgi:hypothetical protein
MCALAFAPEERLLEMDCESRGTRESNWGERDKSWSGDAGMMHNSCAEKRIVEE